LASHLIRTKASSSAVIGCALLVASADAQTAPSANPPPAAPAVVPIPPPPAPGDQAGASMATPVPSASPSPSPTPPAPPAAGTPAAEQAIRAAYALQTGPLIKDDLAAARALAAPDFKTITLSGRVITRAQWLQSTQRMESALGPKALIQVTFHSIKWQGAEAIVEDAEDIKAPLHQGAQVHAFEEKGVSREVWGVVGDKWMIHSSTTLSETDFIDGHPVSQSK